MDANCYIYLFIYLFGRGVFVFAFLATLQHMEYAQAAWRKLISSENSLVAEPHLEPSLELGLWETSSEFSVASWNHPLWKPHFSLALLPGPGAPGAAKGAPPHPYNLSPNLIHQSHYLSLTTKSSKSCQGLLMTFLPYLLRVIIFIIFLRIC